MYSEHQLSAAVRWATLFKCHFWDDFVERQFLRLTKQLAARDVYVVVDETKGKISGITHPQIVRITEEISESEGYLRFPADNLFWYNTDYQVYHFFDRFPDYEYVVICEYDCVVNFDIAQIIQTMVEEKLDFVGEPIRVPIEKWRWAKTARPLYPDHVEISGRLVCFAAFSRGFANKLQFARRDHTQRILSQGRHSGIAWPNNEAFVGSEIARLQARERPLSDFGKVERYNWWPPSHERDLPLLQDQDFLHPVLDERKYVASCLQYGSLHSYFLPNGQLRRLLSRSSTLTLLIEVIRRIRQWASRDRDRSRNAW